MLKSNVIFRDYESFGYITDNRNFGYKYTNDTQTDIGDKILSESGLIFLSVLKNQPQSLDSLVGEILKKFNNVSTCTLMNDAFEFYCYLERDGFIVSGDTFENCKQRDQTSFKNFKSDLNYIEENSSKKHSIDTTQDFFEKYYNGKRQLTNLHIEIISKCNERCVHCYIPHKYKKTFLDPHIFYNILEQCREMKLLHITISGGEPMLHKNFCDFLIMCNDYNFSINILSNLTLLNEEILSEMKRNPLLSVQVSLYSMDSEIHDGITQVKGSFEKTMKAIQKLVDNNVPLQISCPIIKQNKDSFGDVIEWAKRLHINVGVDYNVIGSYDHTTNNLDCRLSLDDVSELTKNKSSKEREDAEKQIKQTARKNTVSLDDYVCSVGHSSICIADNGKVYPCAGWQSCVVGDVKTTPLKEIWENSKKLNYLRGLRNRNFKKCISCQDKEFCVMCMVRNANENSKGDPLVVNKFFCEIAKLKREIALMSL